jgi:hypothetical protein
VECGVRLAGAGPEHRHDSIIDPRLVGLRQFQSQAGSEGAPVPGALGKENGRGSP